MAVMEQSTVDNDHRQQQPCPSNSNSASKQSAPNASTSINVKSRSTINITINTKGKTNIVRKRLGCRRSRKDMLSPEDQQRIKIGDDTRRELKPQRRLIFTSPRVISSDEDLFPSNHALYKESNDRWQQISDQAGSHRQDGTVMNIGRRPSTAIAFRKGMIGCAAVRVRSLNLWLDHEKDNLPDWLEMIREVFVNLEHLTLTEDIFPGEDDLAVSARMRRLYVLSILLNLKSIDDMVVTPKEREMANPGSSSDQLKLDEDELQSPSTDSNIDSRIMSILVSIDTDYVGSSRVNGIEVEFLASKFQEMNHTQTGTTANSSPTTNSETTFSAVDTNIDSRIKSIPVLIDPDYVGSSRVNGIEVEFLASKFQDMNHTQTGTTASSSSTTNSETTFSADDTNIDSRITSIPVLIDPDYVGSSRVNGIEVEFLASKFRDVNHTKTETTASSSPTTNSETTILSEDTDDHFVFEEEDRLIRAAFWDKTITVPPIPSIETKFDNSYACKNDTNSEMQKQVVSTEKKDFDLKHRFDDTSMEGVPTRSTSHHDQNTVCNAMSRNNDNHSDDDMRKKLVMARVSAFHSDSNHSIELVSVASTDLEWPAACGFLNFRKDKTCAPKIRPPFSSGDMKTITVAHDTQKQACQESMTSLRDKEREKENSNLEAFSPQACTPVQRQSKVIVSVFTPQVGCCLILKNDPCSTSKFSFPTAGRHVSTTKKSSHEKLSDFGVSANQQLPPSKSLSSPFPMQFRERQKPSCITTTTHLVVKTSDSINCDSRKVQPRRDRLIQNEMKTIASPLLAITATSPISSPKAVDRTSKTAQKGDLPPPCPFEKIRHKTAADYKSNERKPRRRNQWHDNNVLKESARSISVMDLDD
jgi:hypothetical protein